MSCRPGESLSALGMAPIPDPWSFLCEPSANYVDEVKRVNLPFTDCLLVGIKFPNLKFQID